MELFPDIIIKAWENRKGPAVFTTVDEQGIPNSIYVSCIKIYDETKIVIADNYFHKTLKNIKNGGKGSILFITGDKVSFQLKGKVKYESSGEVKQYMRDCLDPKYPVHGVAVFYTDEIFNGSKKIL